MSISVSLVVRGSVILVHVENPCLLMPGCVHTQVCKKQISCPIIVTQAIFISVSFLFVCFLADE